MNKRGRHYVELPNISFWYINVIYWLHPWVLSQKSSFLLFSRKIHPLKPYNDQCRKFDSQTLKLFAFFFFFLIARHWSCFFHLYILLLWWHPFFAAIVIRPFGKHTTMPRGGRHFCVGASNNGFAQRVWIIIVGQLLLSFGTGCANQVNSPWSLSLFIISKKGLCFYV